MGWEGNDNGTILMNTPKKEYEARNNASIVHWQGSTDSAVAVVMSSASTLPLHPPPAKLQKGRRTTHVAAQLSWVVRTPGG